MNIETNEQAAQTTEQLLCFLRGLDVGSPHHLGTAEMIRRANDLLYFLIAEKAEITNFRSPGPCPGHVASDEDKKVCGRCGVHIDEYRPEPEDAP